MSSTKFCPRLVDYVVLVGSHSSNRTSAVVQTPVILNRFPPTDHPDFVLPPDVALFCQPEGCFTSCGPHSLKQFNQSLPGRSPVSFVFTITDKESSMTRYGVCLNFMRPIRRRHGSRKQSASYVEDKQTRKSQKHVNGEENEPSFIMTANERFRSVDETDNTKLAQQSGRRLRTHTLTSLCILTHHPFFTKFRALLEFLHKLIQKMHERSRSKLPERETVWGVLTGAVSSVSSPLIIRSVREIEVWILRLLSAPAPIPGKTCLHLSVQPKTLTHPLVFALPDKSRLPLVDFPLHLPIQLMGVARTLRILVCLLLEQKVVLQSADYNKLSLCVLAFTALLYPLQYMFPVIPLLPPCMADAEQLLIAPTPYIIGVPTAFYSARKVFRMPKDVWLANLDTQELSYPEVLEEVPDLPDPECSNLIKQLNHVFSAVKALNTLPSISSNPSLDLAMNQVNQLFKNSAAKNMSGYNPLTYITDEASTSVATRVSMVLFLLAKNILGGLPEYTRTLRLYPRPVVAFQFERFMRSRPRPCLFTSMLARTQAVEYYAEYSLCAQNEAYQRIEAGEFAPEVIGDKAEWFADFLTPIHFDVWPEAITGAPSDSGLTNACSGSPLLYALVAARLQYNSQLSNLEDVDAAGPNTSDFRIESTRDDLSDYPTDESASDTETERSTTSIGSTLSDLTSDCVDSGIGEPQSKLASAKTHGSGSIAEPNEFPRDSDDSTESIFIRAGEPLPSGLVNYFNPPSMPVLAKSPGWRANGDTGFTLSDKQDEPTADELDADKDGTASSVGSESKGGDSSAKSTKSPNLSAGQTLRALTKLSANMFNTSPSRMSDPERLSQNVVTDGRINWNASVFLLLNELLNLNGSDSSNADQSAEITKAINRRLNEETYVVQVANTIKSGNTPSIFSRSRVISMLECEDNRNLLLARLNLGTVNASNEHGLAGQPHMPDVPIASWNQYKAMVWILRHITQGLETSLRSDVFIPTPANVHSEAYANARARAVPSTDETARGGLASVFVLLEIAHTHYYQLPARPGRGFFTGTRASMISLDADRSRASISRPESPCTPDEEKTKNDPTPSKISDADNEKSPDSESEQVNLDSGSSERGADVRTASLSSNFGRQPSITTYVLSPTGAQRRVNIYLPKKLESGPGSISHSPPLSHSGTRTETDGSPMTATNASGVFTFPPDSDADQRCTQPVRSPVANTDPNSREEQEGAEVEENLNSTKSSQSHGYRYYRSRLLTPDSNPIVAPVTSPISSQYRASVGDTYYLRPSQVTYPDRAQTMAARLKVGRTYVFEDLTNGNQIRHRLWDNLQFWEDAFLDAVAQERDMLGMDFRPTDLLARYNSATPLKRKHVELEEDRLLAGLMHNVIAYMIMMGVDRTNIRRKIRRLLAKSHMGLHYSQEISNLLDVLDLLYGNDIDLKTPPSRATPQHAYEVYSGTDKNENLLFIEVCSDFLLIRNLTGSIVDRWWYDQMINVTYRMNKQVLAISVRLNDKVTVQSFYTPKCQTLYNAIQQAMEQMSLQSQRGPLGGDLTGELHVVDIENRCPGTIKIGPDGFFINSNQKETFIGISHIKRCSAPQHDIFLIEYFDQDKKRLCTRQFETDMAPHLLGRFQLMIAKASGKLTHCSSDNLSDTAACETVSVQSTKQSELSTRQTLLSIASCSRNCTH